MATESGIADLDSIDKASASLRKLLTTTTTPTAPTPPVDSTSKGPSGLLPPKVGDSKKGKYASWKCSQVQDFTAVGVPKGWGTYDTQWVKGKDSIPSTPGGIWRATQVSIPGDGVCHLKAGWMNNTDGVLSPATGAIAGQSQQYMKIEVRSRLPKMPGLKYAWLMWPGDGVWPAHGEIDFAEDGGGDRQGITATNHWADAKGAHQQNQVHQAADFTKWHTVGVEWSKGHIVYTLDGEMWGEAQGTVQDLPMFPALQIEASPTKTQWIDVFPAGASCVVDIDWVAIYTAAS